MSAERELLTPGAVEAAAAAGTPPGTTRKLNDGDGLFLLIMPNAAGWRFRYKRAGKDALMSLGVYPDVSLSEARKKAEARRQEISSGLDPAAVRAAERADAWLAGSKTFGVTAAEYNAKVRDSGKAGKTVERCERMLKHTVKLHNRQFSELTRPMLLAACEALENAGKRETAHRLGVYFGQVFRFARDKGYFAGVDPTLGGFGKSLKPVQEKHQAAVTDPVAVGKLLDDIDFAWIDFSRGTLTPTVARALQLLARTAVRPGELRNAEWSEFDLDGSDPKHNGAATWVIPVHRMKMRDGNRTDHIVPLSTQAVEILKAQHAESGHGRYVFPGALTGARPITDATMAAALKRLGYGGKHVPHGFRSTFATLARDMVRLNDAPVESEIIERQLAHKVGNAIAGAYDRAQRIDDRRALVQAYSDLLDKLRAG